MNDDRFDAPDRGDHEPMEGIARATGRTHTGSAYERNPYDHSSYGSGGSPDRIKYQIGEWERSRRERVQEPISDLLSVRSFDDLQQQVRAHPIGVLALAAGIGFALQRSHLLDGRVGRARSRDADLSPAEERLLAWLNDMYALEKAQIPILENHADDARSQPHVREKDLEHLDRTKHHIRMVRRCIELLGRKPSKTKTAVGRIAGAMNSLTTEPFDDEVVRNFLADFASENLEIASYMAIIVAAREAGHPEIARICREILADEEEMVDWLRANLPRAVRDTLGELDIIDRQPVLH